MGMKCTFLVASMADPAARLKDLPQLDVAASDTLATEILGKRTWGRSRRAHRSGDLASDVHLDVDEIAIGAFGDITIVAYQGACEWIEGNPPAWGRALIAEHEIDVFALQSTVNMGAFAFWRDARLTRAYAGGDGEVFVDDGAVLPFEHEAAPDDGDFGRVTELAMLDRLGYCYEGPRPPNAIDPATVPLLVYR